jgi:aryl-alcohol dehydrogenase-like predicted oxidoreductase
MQSSRSSLVSVPTMPMRRLGRTNLKVSALALGTVELGLDYGIAVPGDFGKPHEQDAIRLVHAALEAGINLIDTARAYGASEEVLGRALTGRREQVLLATKAGTQGPGGAPLSPDDLARTMQDSLDTSLRTLATDYVDIWQVHNVDEATLAQAEVVADLFARNRAAGKIRFSGGSFYGADLPRRALAHNLFDVMQITYSILDQRLADQFFDEAQAADVGILARSVLLKGALTPRAEHLPDHLSPLRLRYRALTALIGAAGLPAATAQVAIAFALAQPAIHAVLIGVRTTDELRQNLDALAVALPPELMAQLSVLRLDDANLLNPATWGIP